MLRERDNIVTSGSSAGVAFTCLHRFSIASHRGIVGSYDPSYFFELAAASKTFPIGFSRNRPVVAKPTRAFLWSTRITS